MTYKVSSLTLLDRRKAEYPVVLFWDPLVPQSNWDAGFVYFVPGYSDGWNLANTLVFHDAVNNYVAMINLCISIVGICALGMSACSNSINMPKGNSRGYDSARIVKRAPDSIPIQTSREVDVHNLIHKNIQHQFTSHGLSFNSLNSDLLVAYMVIYQDSSITTAYDDYFGYHRNGDEILNIAHEKGVVDGKRPEYFERAGLLVDVIDSKTNKLIYRNISVGDLVNGPSDVRRPELVRAAVNEALAAFFK